MIGIIGFNSLKIMQYLYKYTEILDSYDIEYEVIFWNRDNEDICLPNNYIHFDYKVNTYKSFIRKINSFFKYTIFLYKTIRSKKYDKLILLTSQTIVTLFPLVLSKTYKYKYIYDFRDITFERFPYYKFLVRKLIKNSSFTAISSPGFINVLGKSDKYVISHNCNNLRIKGNKENRGNTINIVYWGMVRQVEFNKKICDLFSNDRRFKLIYHGEGYYKELQNYCLSKNYTNISFTGTYNSNEIDKFAEETGILLNAYENDEQQKMALTVKLYDAVRYMLPMIVSKNSYMEEFVDKYNISYSLNIDDGINLDNLYNWINEIDRIEINNDYQSLYKVIDKDNEYFKNKLIDFASKKI